MIFHHKCSREINVVLMKTINFSMFRISRIVLCIAIFLCLSHVTSYSNPDTINHYFINAARIARPSVVSISVYVKKISDEKPVYKKVADATGTLMSSDGLIITNYHVVSKGNYFEITDYNGNVYSTFPFNATEQFLADIKTDIAILKIDNRINIDLIPIKTGNSNDLAVGEWVLAIGNPYGLNQSITGGIVSSKGRDNVGFTDIEDFIQTDVSINPGNSGGPLVNLNGEMVGINTAIRTVSGGYQGISFAIPSNIVQRTYNDLIAYGRVRRGWLGFIAREKKISGRSGASIVEIISVTKNSPAMAAGIKKGDIIKKINGAEINSLGALIKYVANMQIGSKMYLATARDGKIIDFKFVLREQNEYKKIRSSLIRLFELYGIEIEENAESDNLIISYISPNKLTYMLRNGDIVYSINNFRVYTLEDFIEKFNRAEMKILKFQIIRNFKMFEINLDDYN